jgi:chemotaxis methyl-accepting protein methylase
MSLPLRRSVHGSPPRLPLPPAGAAGDLNPLEGTGPPHLTVKGDPSLSIVATDVDEALLRRARDGCYGRTTLREIPPELTLQAFARDGSRFCVRPQYREGVEFLKQDLRSEAPPGRFDIVLCRNIAFTYFIPLLRQKVLAIIADSLIPNGFLVVGTHEQIDHPRFVAAPRMSHIFLKVS